MFNDFFQEVYIPRWYDQLNLLEQTALPEPWRFSHPAFERKNQQNAILEKYILTIFKNQVIDHHNAKTPDEADKFFNIRRGYACFHTGLLTRRYKPVYCFLEKNRREGAIQDWILKGFFDDSFPLMRAVDTLPQKPFSYLWTDQWAFHPDWPIRVNVDHILDDADNLERIPEGIRCSPNLHMLLEVGVEYARRMAEYIPSIAVPQLYQGRVQYLLPISLQDPQKPELAMTITPMEGFYVGNTCLNLEMAYSNARLLARPTTPWLAALVG